MHDDDELTPDQAERVWARVEAFIAEDLAADGATDQPDGRVAVLPVAPTSTSAGGARWMRAAIVVVVVGLAVALGLALHSRTDHPETTTQTLTVADLARQAGDARPVAATAPRYLAVKVHHPDAVEEEENWIDASGRGCFRAQQLEPVADPGGGTQCGEDMVRIGGLTLPQLEAVAQAPDPAAALDDLLVANDALNTAGVRAELVATLLAWGDIDPAVRAAGFELLDRAGFTVEEATPERIVLLGPGAEGQIRIVVDPSTTQVRRYASTEGPTSRSFAPGRQALPD